MNGVPPPNDECWSKLPMGVAGMMEFELIDPRPSRAARPCYRRGLRARNATVQQ